MIFLVRLLNTNRQSRHSRKTGALAEVSHLPVFQRKLRLSLKHQKASKHDVWGANLMERMVSFVFLLLVLLCNPTGVHKLFAQGDVSFVARKDFGVGDAPYSVTVGDFNGDTIEDLATANISSDNVSILLGKGDGTFLSAQDFGAGDRPHSVTVGDFNGDTIEDLAVANRDSDNVSILLGQGDGTFRSAQNFGAGNGPYSVSVGDFNGDTIEDLAVANRFSDNVSILLGQGDGTFRSAQNFGAGDFPYSVTVGDFNGDTIEDLVTANERSDNVSILVGQGDGTFRSAQNFGVGVGPLSVTVGDFNGDTIEDLATANAFSDDVSILLGQGDGTFLPAQHFGVEVDFTCGGVCGDGPYSVTVGDFNGDTIEDLAVTNDHPDIVSIHLGQGDGTFLSAQIFGVGDRPRSVTVGDFNGDTIKDLAVANQDSNNVSILLGKGDGTFLSAQDFGAGDGPVSVTVGDFNGDTIEDLAVADFRIDNASFGADNVSILLGQGDGTFLSAQTFRAGAYPRSITVGDFNGDTIEDLAVANFASGGKVSVLLGQGDGTFLTAQSFGADGSPSVTVGDFNGDTIEDLAAASFGADNVSILLGQGDGTFLSAQNFGAGDRPQSVTVGDFNGDAIEDLAVANAASRNVSIHLGQGDGTFLSAQNYDAGGGPWSVTVGDFNGDTIEDLAVANPGSNDVSILLGQGDGTFLSAQNFGVGDVPIWVTVGDFNGDTIEDLATANIASDNVSILIGVSSGAEPPAPTISQISPTSGPPGTHVVIQGTDLTGDTVVRFNGVEATILSVTATEIVALVPRTATTGTLTITTAAGTTTTATSFTVFAATTEANLTLNAGGAAAYSTIGPYDAQRAGYATVGVDSGTAPYGTAVFSFTQNDVVVSEVGVPASPPTTSARIFVDFRSQVQPGIGTIDIFTGLAAVNRGTETAQITFTLRDASGTTIATGTISLAQDAHFAKFLHQFAPDFVLPANFEQTGLASLEITSDQPLSILALRLTTNQRGDLLLTSTPIADLTQPATTESLFYPQVTDGGGYVMTLIFLNTSNALETGMIEFFDGMGAPMMVGMVGGAAADSKFSYSIAAGGFARFVTDGSPEDVNTGWVKLTPDMGTSTPVGAGIFSLTQDGTLVTESGVPSAVATNHAIIYIDTSGGHNTGLAIANPNGTQLTVTVQALALDGMTPAGGGPGNLNLVGSGHSAQFVGEMIPGGLPEGFTGVADIQGDQQFVALTLRSLNNLRGDFLLTTFPIADANQAAPTPVIFPQIADGDGFQTQFIFLGIEGATITVKFLGDDGSPIDIGKNEGPNP